MVSPHLGRSTRRFRRIRDNLRARRLPCCLCGLPIDYTLPANHSRAFTTAHDLSVAARPDLAEEPSNIRGAAHRDCNSAEGSGPGLVIADDTPGSHDW